MDELHHRPEVSHRLIAVGRFSNLAMATFLLAGIATLSAVAAMSAITNTDETALTTGSIRPDQQIAIGMVRPGEEGISLTARLSERGIDPLKDVIWKITDRLGGTVFDGKATQADAPVPPGDYIVEARYEGTLYQESITVREGNKVSVNFILNVGGLRVLPTLQGVTSFPPPSTTRIFSLSGVTKGKLVASSKIPGEVLKVSAGSYRIENRFDLGNAVAVSDVTVKSGIMSAVHVGHKAGSVRLSVQGNPAAAVSWKLISEHGTIEPQADLQKADIVLKPGRYTAIAVSSGQMIERQFDVQPGDVIDVTFGDLQ